MNGRIARCEWKNCAPCTSAPSSYSISPEVERLRADGIGASCNSTHTSPAERPPRRRSVEREERGEEEGWAGLRSLSESRDVPCHSATFCLTVARRAISIVTSPKRVSEPNASSYTCRGRGAGSGEEREGESAGHRSLCVRSAAAGTHRHVDRFVEFDVVELVELHGRLRAEGRGAPRALDGRVGLVLVAVAPARGRMWECGVSDVGSHARGSSRARDVVAVALDARVAVEGGGAG